jgi:hypothetical protein
MWCRSAVCPRTTVFSSCQPHAPEIAESDHEESERNAGTGGARDGRQSLNRGPDQARAKALSRRRAGLMRRIGESRRPPRTGAAYFVRRSRDVCVVIRLHVDDREEIVESGRALADAENLCASKIDETRVAARPRSPDPDPEPPIEMRRRRRARGRFRPASLAGSKGARAFGT